MVARPAIIIVDLLAGMVLYLEERVGDFHEDILRKMGILTPQVDDGHDRPPSYDCSGFKGLHLIARKWAFVGVVHQKFLYFFRTASTESLTAYLEQPCWRAISAKLRPSKAYNKKRSRCMGVQVASVS